MLKITRKAIGEFLRETSETFPGKTGMSLPNLSRLFPEETPRAILESSLKITGITSLEIS